MGLKKDCNRGSTGRICRGCSEIRGGPRGCDMGHEESARALWAIKFQTNIAGY